MPSAPAKHSPQYPQARRHCPPEQSRQARRTLATNSAEWLAIRERILLRDSYRCRDCGCLCHGKGNAHVDHVNGDDSNNDDSNLQTLCRRCHSSKTARENRGFGNRSRDGHDANPAESTARHWRR
jgi:5-methylcytosine-specific restriction protein A